MNSQFKMAQVLQQVAAILTGNFEHSLEPFLSLCITSYFYILRTGCFLD